MTADKGITITQEGAALTLYPRSTPGGLGKDITTFELVAENLTAERLHLILADAVLLDDQGIQYAALRPEQLPAFIVTETYRPFFGFYTHIGPYGFYRHGSIITVPEVRVRSTQVRERGLAIAEHSIYPHASVRGYLYFPCNKRTVDSQRIIITRLVRDRDREVVKETRDDGTQVTQTPVQELTYEFEFDIQHH